LNRVLLQPQLRPSPVTSKRERASENLESVVFNPFSPATKKMTEVTGHHHSTATAMTPERVRSGELGLGPGSALSSFSPFISPNYMEAMAHAGMSITPGIVGIHGSSRMMMDGKNGNHQPHTLQGSTPSWDKMLNDTFRCNSFGETPSRKLDAFLEATGMGPKLPTTEELARPKAKLLKTDEDADEGRRDGDRGVTGCDDDEGGVPIINANFSFSDVVLSPRRSPPSNKQEGEDSHAKVLATAVTDSGPLRMRLKTTSKDLSTHHFDAWQSPMGANVTGGRKEDDEEDEDVTLTITSTDQCAAALATKTAEKAGRKSKRIESRGKAKNVRID